MKQAGSRAAAPAVPVRRPAVARRTAPKSKTSPQVINRQVIAPPILAVTVDNTGLHVFESVRNVVTHDGEHTDSFAAGTWDLYDSGGNRLVPLSSGNGVSGLTKAATLEAVSELRERVVEVIAAVRNRIPDDDGQSLDVLDELESLDWPELLQNLVELMPEAEAFHLPGRTTAEAAIRSRRPRTGSATPGAAVGGSGGSTAAAGRAHAGASDLFTPTGGPPQPHTGSWWHNMFGH